MITDTKVRHITPIGGNIFLDIGFEPDEAEKLFREAKLAIEKKIAIKENLMGELSNWIAETHMKQSDVASILGVTRPRVSDVVRNKSENFTVDSLIDMINRTGKQVMVSVR